MYKHIYKIIACLVIYIAFLFIFGNGLREKDNTVETINSLSESSFPVVYIQAGDNLVNLMHGYMSNLNARYVRDGIAPISSNNQCDFCIMEYSKEIKKVSYEISDTSGSQIVDAGTVKTFGEKEDYKTFSISIHEQLSEGTEYVLKMVLLTSDADKIYYYTRIKKTDVEGMDNILKFANDFHEKTISKKDNSTISTYLETDKSLMTDTDYSYVNIKSGIEMITFGKLNMEVISEVFTTIREVEGSTAVVELTYYAKTTTDSGEEVYKINEGYRIRWTSDRTFLLFFERTMEAMFDPALLSTASGEFKIGITSEKNVEVVANTDNSKMCFVRNGELWYYNNPTNKITKLFSFSQEDVDYVRDLYDEHDIKIVNMEDGGDTYFMVYGYMNRGDYEGQTCMILYKFYAEEDRVEELANIPVDVTFGMLKEQLSDFYFVNDDETFFFTLAKKIFSYNIEQKKLKVIAEDVLSDDMTMSKKENYIAWQTSKDDYAKINVMNLDNEKINTIKAKNGTCVKVLGNMDGSLIYGVANKKKVSELIDGTLVIPISNVNISDQKGKVIKEYKPDKGYVTNIQTQDNKIILKKVKSSDNGKFIEIADDCIFNNQKTEKVTVEVKSRTVEKTKLEWYLAFPDTVTIKYIPDESGVKFTLVKDDTTVRIDENIMHDKHYYVYACHGLESGFDKASDAINEADSRMGMVVDNQGFIVWERGLAEYASNIRDLTLTKTNGGLNSIQTCIKTLVAESGESVTDKEIASEKGAITDILDKYLKGTSVNLTGTNLKYLQYLLTKKKPVLAMLTSSKAVLITAYDSGSITYYDPSSGATSKMSYETAEKKFAEVGSVFIGSLD